MSRILVSYATRTGTTRGVAESLGEALRRHGHEVVVQACRRSPSCVGFDAVVVGSAVHHGRWLTDAIDYLKAEAPDLAERPTWLFQTGPCADGEEAGYVGATPVPTRVLRIAGEIGAAGPATFTRPSDDPRTPAEARSWIGTGPCFGPFGDADGATTWAAVISDWAERHHAASAADQLLHPAPVG